MKKHKPADKIQDLQYFGEFGGVNPSISDSSTYTFLSAKTMFDTFEEIQMDVICIHAILRQVICIWEKHWQLWKIQKQQM